MARTKKHSHPIEIDWRLKKIKDGFNIQIKDPYLGIFWITKKQHNQALVFQSSIDAAYWIKVSYPYSFQNQAETV